MAKYTDSLTRCILHNDLVYINQNDWTIGNQGLDGISPENFKLCSSDGTEYVEILCASNFID